MFNTMQKITKQLYISGVSQLSSVYKLQYLSITDAVPKAFLLLNPLGALEEK